MRRFGVMLCGLALAGAIAQAQTVVIGVKPASLAPVIVFPASAVNGAGTVTTTICFDASSADTCLLRDAANTLAQRNAANAQNFNIYNTFTAGTPDYERAVVGWGANVFSILVGANGTGASRSMAIGTGSTSTGTLSFRVGGTNVLAVLSTGLSNSVGSGLLVGTAAPTISSGFGTSPTIANNNGAAAFTINVGTGGVATSGVIGLPTATTGWNCQATDITTNSATVFLTKQTASTTTTATIGNFNTSAAAAAWVASDILRVSCFAY